MPAVKIKYVVSFSSQDPRNPVDNLLGTDRNRKWLNAPGDKSGNLQAEFQLEQASYISHLDIGAHFVFTVQVTVGRSSWPQKQEFQTLLPTATLMKPTECRQGDIKVALRMFKPEHMNTDVLKEKWDRVRITVTQPFRKEIQFGLSMLNIITDQTKQAQIASQMKCSPQDAPTSGSISALHNHFFKSAPNGPSRHVEQMKNHLLKVGASTENGSESETAHSRTLKMVVAAASSTPNYKRPHSDSPNTASPFRRQKIPFEDEIKAFLSKVDITSLNLETFTFADLRHRFEKQKIRKLSKEERKQFFATSQIWMDKSLELPKTSPKSPAQKVTDYKLSSPGLNNSTPSSCDLSSSKISLVRCRRDSQVTTLGISGAQTTPSPCRDRLVTSSPSRAYVVTPNPNQVQEVTPNPNLARVVTPSRHSQVKAVTPGPRQVCLVTPSPNQTQVVNTSLRKAQVVIPSSSKTPVVTLKPSLVPVSSPSARSPQVVSSPSARSPQVVSSSFNTKQITSSGDTSKKGIPSAGNNIAGLNNSAMLKENIGSSQNKLLITRRPNFDKEMASPGRPIATPKKTSQSPGPGNHRQLDTIKTKRRSVASAKLDTNNTWLSTDTSPRELNSSGVAKKSKIQGADKGKKRKRSDGEQSDDRQSKKKRTCPVCQKKFPAWNIQTHAAMCCLVSSDDDDGCIISHTPGGSTQQQSVSVLSSASPEGSTGHQYVSVPHSASPQLKQKSAETKADLQQEYPLRETSGFTEDKAECPLCFVHFPCNILEIHAEDCEGIIGW